MRKDGCQNDYSCYLLTIDTLRALETDQLLLFWIDVIS